MKPPSANPEPTPKAKPSMVRIAVLVAASTVALTACGASAAGSTSTAATTAPAAAPAPGAAAGAAATVDVGIVNFNFAPAALTVKAGTTVVWTNNDTEAHSVNFMTSGINSNVLNQHDQFTYTFTVPGTYAYICSIHPFMHGSVTVTA